MSELYRDIYFSRYINIEVYTPQKHKPTLPYTLLYSPLQSSVWPSKPLLRPTRRYDASSHHFHKGGRSLSYRYDGWQLSKPKKSRNRPQCLTSAMHTVHQSIPHRAQSIFSFEHLHLERMERLSNCSEWTMFPLVSRSTVRLLLRPYHSSTPSE